MRKVINKMVTEEDLIRTVATAYSHGWRQVKLYFMCGLPTETDEDVLAIADLAKKVIAKGREVVGSQRHPLHGLDRWVRAQAAHAVPVGRPARPRDHRRAAAAAARDGARRQAVRPRDRLPLPRRQARHHRGTAVPRRPPRRPRDRAGLARRRPVRRLERALLLRPLGRARRRPRWPAPASTSTGTPPASATYDEVLPWDHLDSGLDKDWLWADWEDALAAAADPDGVEDSRTAAGRPATTAACAPRWAPRSRSAPPASSCSRSASSELSARETVRRGSLRCTGRGFEAAPLAPRPPCRRCVSDRGATGCRVGRG